LRDSFEDVRAIALVALFSSACAILTNLDALSSDGGGMDGAVDSSANDAASDADDGGPCVGSLLVGTNDLSGLGPDYISQRSLDVIRFTTTTPGVAKCAWIYLPQGGVLPVYIAAYSLDNGGNPSQLLAQASLANVQIGWNSAVLDSPLTLTANETLWIGALSPSAGIPILDTTTCPAANAVREDGDLSSLPTTFVQSKTFMPCNMGLYLGP
jgi:hypothetical protein